MKNHVMRLSAILACGVLIAAAGMGRPSIASADGNPSATGSGQFHIGTELRTFAFSAIQHKDGTVTGQAQLNNRAIPATDHIVIDCINFTGPHTANISGTITKSSVGAEGDTAVFSVMDNGQGANSPPDMISLVFFTSPSPTFTCNTFFPTPNNAVEHGNIQVRP
jgi:hypothetical protein